MGKYDSLFSEIDASLAPKASNPLARRASYYTPAETPVEQAEEGVTWGDYGRSLMSGGASVVEGLGYLGKKLGFDDVGQFTQDLGSRAVEYWSEGLSPAAKAAMQKQFVESTPEGLAIGDAGWDTVKLSMAQSVLGTAAGGGLGGAITKSLQLIPKLAPTIAGMLGYGAGEAIVASGSAGADVEREIDKMTPEQMADNPAYQAALELNGGDPVKAKAYVKAAAGSDAAARTAISTFLLSAPFGAMMGKFTAGIPLATTRARSIATGAAGEAGQEFLQSGAEALSKNSAIQENADSSRSLTHDLLNDAIGGGLAGGVMGGAMGVVSPLETPEQPVADPVVPPATAPAIPPPPAELPLPVLPKPSTKKENFNYGARKLTDILGRGQFKGPAQLLAEARRRAELAGLDAVAQAKAGADTLAASMASFRGPVIPNPFNDSGMGILGNDPVQQRVADAVLERETAPKTGEYLPAEVEQKGGLPAVRASQESTIAGEVERPGITNQNIIYGEGPKVAGLLPGKIRTGMTGQPIVSNRSDGTSQPIDKGFKAEVARLKELASKVNVESRKKRTGKATKAWTPNNKELDLRFEVVESSKLLKSNDDAGNVNPNYPQDLQPRDRSSMQSRNQITEIANKLNPNRLGDNPEVSNGAPIVDPDTLAVIAGNGRSMAMDRHFRMGDKAGYKQWLIKNAKRFGLNPEVIATMKNPVLVRNLLTPMTTEEKVDMAGRSNDRGNLAMTPTETAVNDAKRITDDVLADIVDGDMTKAANLPFIRKMVQAFGGNEAAGLMDTSGNANQALRDRLRNAIVAKAYGNKRLTKAVAEGSTEDRKVLSSALVEMAASFTKLQKTGRYSGISNEISDAMTMLNDADSRNLTIDEYLRQGDLDATRSEAAEVLARFFDRNKKSKPAIVEGLRQVYDELQGADDYQSAGSDIFGEYTPPTTSEIVKRRLKDETDRAKNRQGDGGNDTGSTGKGGSRRSQGNSASDGRDQAVQGAAQAEAAVEPEEFGLNLYSESDIAEKEKAQRDAAEAEAAKAKAEQDKIKADEAVDDFNLSGSNAPADIAMANGQTDIFADSPTTPEPSKPVELPSKKYIPNSLITIKETVTIAETGEQVEIESKADVLLRQIDKKLATYKALLECVRT